MCSYSLKNSVSNKFGKYHEFFFLFFLVRSFSSTSSKEISRLVHVRTFSHKMGQTKLPSFKTDWHLCHKFSVHTAFYL